MNKTYILSIAFSALFFFSSCSKHSNKYHPVRNHLPRVSSLGFHISPPPGDNWYEKHLNESLYYLKRNLPDTYVLTTMATELLFKDNYPLRNDFLEYVKSQKRLLEKSSGRYRNCILYYSIEETSSSLCVRYQQKYDDYGDKGKGNYAFVKVVSKGLVCKHPESSRVGIDISYMEKSIPQANNPSYKDEGENFLRSLKFLPFSKL